MDGIQILENFAKNLFHNRLKKTISHQQRVFNSLFAYAKKLQIIYAENYNFIRMLFSEIGHNVVFIIEKFLIKNKSLKFYFTVSQTKSDYQRTIQRRAFNCHVHLHRDVPDSRIRRQEIRSLRSPILSALMNKIR